MRITSKGQVTIPIAIREQAGFLPSTDVEFEFDGAAVRLVKSPGKAEARRGARMVAAMRGTSDVAMTTDEIMALTRGD